MVGFSLGGLAPQHVPVHRDTAWSRSPCTARGKMANTGLLVASANGGSRLSWCSLLPVTFFLRVIEVQFLGNFSSAYLLGKSSSLLLKSCVSGKRTLWRWSGTWLDSAPWRE